MKMKTCSECNTEKSTDEFPKALGYKYGISSRCRQCKNKSGREYYLKNRKKVLARNKEYAKTENGQKVQSKVEWNLRNPLKKKAHIIIREAIKYGRMIKNPCVVCGSGNVHGHHDDYSKPLDVVWLCPAHHAERHRQLKDEGGF